MPFPWGQPNPKGPSGSCDQLWFWLSGASVLPAWPQQLVHPAPNLAPGCTSSTPGKPPRGPPRMRTDGLSSLNTRDPSEVASGGILGIPLEERVRPAKPHHQGAPSLPGGTSGGNDEDFEGSNACQPSAPRWQATHEVSGAGAVLGGPTNEKQGSQVTGRPLWHRDEYLLNEYQQPPSLPSRALVTRWQTTLKPSATL